MARDRFSPAYRQRKMKHTAQLVDLRERVGWKKDEVIQAARNWFINTDSAAYRLALGSRLAELAVLEELLAKQEVMYARESEE